MTTDGPLVRVKQEPEELMQRWPIKYEMEDIKPVITALPLAVHIKQENMGTNFPNMSQQMFHQQPKLEQPTVLHQPSASGEGGHESFNDEGVTHTNKEKADEQENAKGSKENEETNLPEKGKTIGEDPEKDEPETEQIEMKSKDDLLVKDKADVDSEKGKIKTKRMFCKRCHRVFFKESVYLKHKQNCEETAPLAVAHAMDDQGSDDDKVDSDKGGVDDYDTETDDLDDSDNSKKLLDLNKNYTYEKGSYKCDICRFHSLSKAAVLIHVKGHEKFECDICKETLTSFRLLSKHKLAVHDIEHVVTSPVVNSDSASEADSESDSDSDFREDEFYQCKKCPFKCKADSTRKAHKALHMNPKAFICSFCTKPFLRQLGLLRHITVEHKTAEKRAKREKPTQSEPKVSLKGDVQKSTAATGKGDKNEHKKTTDADSVNSEESDEENMSGEESAESGENTDSAPQETEKYRQQDGTYLCVLCMAREDNSAKFKKHLDTARHKFFSSKSWFCNTDETFNCKVCKFDTKYKYQFLGHVSTKKHDGYVTNWYSELDSKKAKYFLKGAGADEKVKDKESPKKNKEPVPVEPPKQVNKSKDTPKSPTVQKKLTSPKAVEQKLNIQPKSDDKLKSPTSHKSPPMKKSEVPKSKNKLTSPTSQKSTATKKADAVQKSEETSKVQDKKKSPAAQKLQAAKKAESVEQSEEFSNSQEKLKSPVAKPVPKPKESQKTEERQRSLRSKIRDNTETSAGQKRTSQDMGKNLPDSTLNRSQERKRPRMDTESFTSDSESVPESFSAPEEISVTEPADGKFEESEMSNKPLNSSSESRHLIQTPLSSRKTATLPSDFADFAEKPYACAMCFFRTGDSEELRLHVQNHLTGGNEDLLPQAYQGRLTPQGHLINPQFIPPVPNNIAYFNPQPYPFGQGPLTPSPHHDTFGIMPIRMHPPAQPLVNTEDLIDPGIDFIKEPANPSPYQCLYCRLRQKNLASVVGHFESKHTDILYAKKVQAKMRREAAMELQGSQLPDQSDASSTTMN